MTISKINVNGQVYDVVDKSFEEKEEVISAALNDINSRIEEKEETISAALNDLNTRIVENEEVISASLNDLNQRISNGGSSLTLATVATSGSYNDLTNKPNLATVATTGSYNDLTNKPTLFSGSYTNLTNKPNFATVATSGSYNDLSNKPTIPAEQIQSDWNLTNTSSKDYIKNKPDLSQINQNILDILDMLMVDPEHAVDMGLPSGLLWCDHNVGALNPEEEGFFFSWGNVTGRNLNGTDSYNFGNNNSLEPYISSNGSRISYIMGSIPVGDTYDMARANMGAPWRLPTNTEFQELYDNCTSEWVTQNGMNGRRFTSNINGNSIFFPAAGYYYETTHRNDGSIGYYWSSVLYSKPSAYFLHFNSESVNPQNYSTRCYGLPVRPVTNAGEKQSVISSLNKRITALENNNNSN